MTIAPPRYVGMPPTDRTYIIEPWGEIRCGGPCRDYARVIPWQNRAGQILQLQRAAAKSLESAETKLGFAIVVTGSSRTCEQQEDYYNSDPPESQARYAPPDKTAHTRGLAIDVSTNLSLWKRMRLKRALRNRGWYQSRPTDEPWHWSFGIQV